MCVRCGRRATEAPSILEHKLETRRSTACAQALGVLEHKLETRRSTACAQRTVVRRRCCLVARCPPLLSLPAYQTHHTMASLKLLNPNSDLARSAHALAMNINASKGLQEVLKSNLGPKGTIKMYAHGARPDRSRST